MNEQMPPGPEQGEKKENAAIENLRAWYKRQGWLDENDPKPEVAPEDRREAGPEIAELEAMVALFEEKYPVEALNAITDLTIKDAPLHPLRQPAKVALEPIVAKLLRLQEETDISNEKYLELHAHYQRLSLAVGFINGLTNKVRHE